MKTGSTKSPSSLSIIRLLPIAIVIFSIVIAVLVGRDRYQLSEWAIKERLTEAKNVATSSAEHVEKYFDAVYTTLSYISFCPEVKLMSDSARPMIQNMFDFHWERHRLAELYLIKKGFDGTNPPFMEFDPPLNGRLRKKLHSLEREAEEYTVQMEHISRFLGDRSLKSLVSGRRQLCIDEKGLVMSVPVKNNGEVVGIVSAMMPEKRVVAELKRGVSQGTSILFNAESEFYSATKIDSHSLEEFERIRNRNAARNLQSSEPFLAENGRTISARINVYGDKNWWLIYDFASGVDEVESELSNAKYIWGPVLSVLVFGLLVAGLMETMRRRHKENLFNLEHIRETEESLRKSEEWLSTTLTSIGDAVIAIDKSSTITFMNRVSEEITGWSRTEAVGKQLSEVFYLDKKPGRTKPTRSIEELQVDPCIVIHGGSLLISKSGAKIPVDHSRAPIRSEDGNILGSVIVFRDVTERIETENRLRRGQALLQSTIESTADGILVVGQSGEVLHTNTRFADMWRIPNELLQSGDDKKLLRFVLDQLTDPDAFLAKVKQLYGSQDTDLDTLHFKDGREFERFSSPLVQDNTISGRVWSFRNITERKQTEKKLEELATIPRSNPNGILTLKTDGTVTYMNPSMKMLLADLQLDFGQIEIIFPRNYLSILKTCFEEKRSFHNFETSYNDRTWLWIFSPVHNQETVHAFAIEITERVQSEAQNLKLSAAVSQSQNSIVITDKQGIIEYVNPKFRTVSGYSLSECKGQSTRILKSGRHSSKFYGQLWETVLAGKTWSGNIQNRSKPGNLYWERKVISPIMDNDNEIIGFIAIGEDITKELQMQQTLIESDKLSAIGMLAAGVAHEFKNYLGGIIGNASFALDDLDSENGIELARETLTTVIDLGEKANNVAMSLLSYSKADPEDFDLEDIREIVQKSVGLIEKELLGSSIEIATYFDEVPRLRLSASKIQQLLLNLLINARHAIKEKGVITLAVKATSNAVEVRIGDTGCGIAEDILPRIFDPFFSTKGVWGNDEVIGTGMGLAISRNIAHEHYGNLTAESIYGIGSTFTLTIPYPEECENTAHESNNLRTRNAALFTLNTSIISSYFKQACQRNVRILPIDNIDNAGENLRELIDFAICDAKFTGKVELHKFTELCKLHNIPIFMIQCGTMEYQLAELHDSADANFKEIPDMDCILDRLLRPDPSKALT